MTWFAFAIVFTLGACSNDSNKKDTMMDMNHDTNTEFTQNNQDENKLAIPQMLEPDKSTKSDIYYTITAQQGETAIKEGEMTKTLGYNGTFLGPVVKVRKGQNVHIKTINQLSEETSFHWHGLKIPSDSDGGPHQPIAANGTADINFTVNQEAATLWFHPHPEGKTAKQVYEGLAGLIYVEDENSDKLDIPKEYGINDIPVIVQDRTFDKDNQLNYEQDYQSDGIQGDTLLVNGTINPYINIKSEKIRLRLLNGSNARNYNFTLDDHSSFYQIASDGGFLEEPVKMNSLSLTPGERAEIIVDASQYKKGDQIKLMNDGTTVLSMNVTEKIKEDIMLPQKLNTIAQDDVSDLPVQKITLSGMHMMVSINGKQFDMERIDLEKKQGEKEIWEVYNAPDMMGGMIHPFHIHGVQFKILSRNGDAPPKNEQGWKDTVKLNPDETVRLEVEFQENGIFMYHCHILEHEENGMMGQVKVY